MEKEKVQIKEIDLLSWIIPIIDSEGQDECNKNWNIFLSNIGEAIERELTNEEKIKILFNFILYTRTEPETKGRALAMIGLTRLEFLDIYVI